MSNELQCVFFLGLTIVFTRYIPSAALQDQVSIRLYSSEHSAPVSENVTLICEISYAFAVPTVKWSRDGQELGTDKKGSWAISARDISRVAGEKIPLYRAILIVINVKREHTYTCESTVGTSKISATVTVRVGPLPYVNPSIKPAAIQAPGQNVQLICEVWSNYPTNVSWSEQPGYQPVTDKLGRFTTRNRTINGQLRLEYELLLNLFPVRKNSSYTCSAENEFGTKSLTLEVITVSVKYGSRCKADLDCETKHSECNDDICDCPFAIPVYVKRKDTCFSASLFSDSCSYTEQCQAMDNMTRCSSKGYCKCVDDAVYHMDVRKCYEPKPEPWAEEVFAGLGGALGFITLANLIMYCIRKRTDSGSQTQRTLKREQGKGHSVTFDDEGPSQRKSRSSSTRSNASSYRYHNVSSANNNNSNDNSNTYNHIVLAQLHAQSLPVPGAHDPYDSTSTSSKNSSVKISSKCSNSSNNLSVFTDCDSRVGSLKRNNKNLEGLKPPSGNIRKHSV